ncbi:MAG: D-aminoacylase [Acidobacteria bacterium]|nr:D-aminoacylase [Acidobacteriota bacterium]MYJ05369.1 D-aminoacylase [Acidobacteriota bacterium]
MQARRFLILLGLVLLAAPLAGQGQERFDLLIRGGRVVDGSGNPWVRADVAIRGDQIARIGHLPEATADRIVDAEGLVVAPGFIDPHTHAVRGIFDVPTADNYLLQGVTTLTEGNDGSSPWPIGDHLERIAELGISPNWGIFAGQGTIRREVIGAEDRDPTRDELDRMRALVAQAMRQGAFGLSTGLFYVPGSFTSTEEVIELSKIAASHGGIYISHMRDEALRLLDSVRETIRIGEEAGIPVQMTHHKAISRDMWGRSADSLALVDAARARGVDITIDQYPYTASQTGITAIVPQWAQAGGTEELIERLRDPETRRRIREEIVYRIEHDRGGGDPANIVIGLCEWDRSLEGKSLADILDERGIEVTTANAADLAMEIIESGGARAIYHAMDERDVERIMQHPATAIGSDGGISVFGASVPHPREYGTFARVLGRYVRERGVLTIEEAIRKMSGATAHRLGLQDRGLLREGFFADIAVFDPDRVIDRATFPEPHQYSEGFVYVLVNGVLVVEGGKHTGARPGRVLYGPGRR